MNTSISLLLQLALFMITKYPSTTTIAMAQQAVTVAEESIATSTVAETAPTPVQTSTPEPHIGIITMPAY
jgi:hypothetical protein